MKYTTYLIILMALLSNTKSYTQDCDCTKDFNQLDKLLRKTPAFKDNKTAYENGYELVKADIANASSDFACLVLLNQLSLGINDNHINVFGLDGTKTIPIDQSSLDLKSLEERLKTKAFSAIEGIYSLPNYVTLGVYKEQEKYIGVILKSEIPNWKVGEIMYTLLPFGEDLFLAIFGQKESKRIVAVSERIKHGMFLKLGLKKNKESKPFHLAPKRDSLFIRKEVDASITYIKAGSFSSFYPKLSDAEAFYKTLNNTLTKKNLIVDLRDNTGGGERNSNILLELLTSYAQQNNIYVLTNHNTASNAEQFTIKLKELPNTEILGDRTQGTLTYELKKNISNNLGCGKFVAIITSKRHKEYLKYESKGVNPDVLLKYDEDWINQAKAFIKN